METIVTKYICTVTVFSIKASRPFGSFVRKYVEINGTNIYTYKALCPSVRVPCSVDTNPYNTTLLSD